MPNAGLSAAVERLRRGGADATDGELLARYVADRDGAAFAALVRRHGGRVYAVCRRVLGDHHLAEDAFQAVFAVLARKADAVRPPAAVGGWLYGVARKAALEAYAVSRRQSRETPVARLPDTPTELPEPPDADALAALDEEVANLSEAYRSAVVLCELDGVPRAEAARRLGIAEGTLSSRLAAARKQLATRLARRGVVLSASLFAAAGSAKAVPPVLADAAAGLASGSLPGGVSVIVRGVMRAMYASKLKLVSAGAVLAAVSLLGLAPAGPRSEPLPPRPRVVAPVPAATNPGKLFIWLDEDVELRHPDGKPAAALKPGESVGFVWPDAALSPDGTKLAWLDRTGFEPGTSAPVFALRVRTVDGKDVDTGTEGIPPYWFRWSRGKEGDLLYLRGAETTDGGEKKAVNWVVDVAAKKLTRLPIPEHHFLEAVSTDGTTALTREAKDDNGTYRSRHHVMKLPDGKPAPMLKENQFIYGARFSPDNKRLLCVVVEYKEIQPQGKGVFVFKDETVRAHVVLDLATGKQAPVKVPGDGAITCGWTWSPDGKQIAYAWYKPTPVPKAPPAKPPVEHLPVYEHHFVVADPDGSNAKEVHKAEGSRLVGFAWQ